MTNYIFPYSNGYVEGITSRDFIVIMVMQGICSNPECMQMTCKEIDTAAYEQADAMIKESENCKKYKPCVTVNETIGNNCDYYIGGNVCNNWQLK